MKTSAKNFTVQIRAATTLAAIVAVSLVGSCRNQCAEETQPAPPNPVAETPATRTEKILSHHDTRAVFLGTREHVCLGRTALCPDKCGNSGTLAVFKIESYNAYEKFGKYGDPKTDEFDFMLRSTTGTSDVSEEIAACVKSLHPGDNVRLVWEHVYVSDETGSFPERRVLEISPLTPPQ